MPKRNKGALERVKIKICGITNLSDALCASRLKVDAVGFVFYPLSPRYLKPAIARKIILRLNKTIKKVGVFVNLKKEAVERIARSCSLDMLQFHGQETPGFCAGFKDYKIIKAFRIKDNNSLKNINRYKSADYYLFDTFKKGQAGGTGDKFNWGLLKGIPIDRPFFISGGLNQRNVQAAIKTACPDWVDASSGLESSPGKKDARLLKKFIEKVRSYEDNP